jgi:cobalt-zinc-cadmium efflux system outer membrane protein
MPAAALCVALALLAAASCGGCAPVDARASLKTVAADLFARTGFHVGDEPAPPDGDGSLTRLASGEALTERQAVNFALLHNAAFQERLADLGLSRADVVQAGLIANPDATLLIPVGPKQLEATITAPLEALWLRGRRLDAAQRSADRAAEILTQAGLDLVRDARLAYADLVLARARMALFEESARLRERVAGIADARVRSGDAAPIDAATARVDALRAGQEARSLVHAVAVAEERLRAVMGAGEVRAAIVPAGASPEPAGADWDVEALLSDALGGRPDARAAELAAAAARDRATLARVEWLSVAFLADANERGAAGFEAGPGFRFTLPVFNQNQGAIARADAEVERALRQQRTLHDRIILEVREAHVRFRQAREDFDAWRSRIRPALEEAVRLAERAYRNGQTPLVQVLDVNRQLLDARTREAQLASDLRRARAELERSVGRRLELTPAAETTTTTTAPATEHTTGPATGGTPEEAR